MENLNDLDSTPSPQLRENNLIFICKFIQKANQKIFEILGHCDVISALDRIS